SWWWSVGGRLNSGGALPSVLFTHEVEELLVLLRELVPLHRLQLAIGLPVPEERVRAARRGRLRRGDGARRDDRRSHREEALEVGHDVRASTLRDGRREAVLVELRRGGR